MIKLDLCAFKNAIRPLQLVNIYNGRRNVFFRTVFDSRHIAKKPTIGVHAVIHCKIVGTIAVVIGFVNLIYQVWAFVCTNSVPSMASDAVPIICDATLDCWL